VARPRPKAMTLTDRAADQVKAIIARAEQDIVGVRVGVKNAGCAGMAYTLEYATGINPHDEVVEDKGVTILIDPKAVMFLLGTEMDFEQDKLKSSFVFRNPNEVERCGCGESFKVAV